MAKQVAAEFPSASGVKIKIDEASETDYLFSLAYPDNAAQRPDAEALVRMMLHRLITTGHKPYDEKIRIVVYVSAISPGTVGETGHLSGDVETIVAKAEYAPDYSGDDITYGTCSFDPSAWIIKDHCTND